MSVSQLLTLFVCALVLHSATVIQSGPLSSRVDNPDPVPGPALHKRVARSFLNWGWLLKIGQKVTSPVPPPSKLHDPTTRSNTTASTRSSPWYENTSVQVALGLGLLVILLACIISYLLYCSNMLNSKSSKKSRKTPKSGAKSGVKSGQGSTGSRITSPGTTGQSNESRLGTVGSSLQGTSPGQSKESRLGSGTKSGPKSGLTSPGSKGTSPGGQAGQSNESRLGTGTKLGPKSVLASPGSQGTSGKARQPNESRLDSVPSSGQSTSPGGQAGQSNESPLGSSLQGTPTSSGTSNRSKQTSS